MVFSGIEFLLGFLPIFLVVYYVTPANFKNFVLFAGSLFFYAYGEPKYVLLLCASVIANFYFGQMLESRLKVSKKRKQKQKEIAKRERAELSRKLLYIGTITLNVTMLVLFKWAPAGIELPLGVSFYTFQIISYLTDVYRGEIKAERSFLKLGTYICMFPQLVAGPIVHYREVSGVLERPAVTSKQFDSGLKTFVWGLVMKVLLADRLSILWHELATIGYISISTPLAWMGAIGYSMQIYFDFYGYSLMAIGLGRMLGYELPINFRTPYMATSIREFYRRWHMTLGRWFTKYVYIPLGGSKKGMIRTLRNLLFVWILTSMWHGMSVNFLLWGMVLCALIMFEKMVAIANCNAKEKVTSKTVTAVKKLVGHVYVLLVIPVTWMCFAISKTDDLLVYLGRMFGLLEGTNINPAVFSEKWEKYGVLILISAVMCTPIADKLYEKWKDRIPGMVVLAGLFWLCVWYLVTMGDNPFMYFRF